MINFGRKADFGRFKWIVSWKVDGQKEDSTLVRTVGLDLGK